MDDTVVWILVIAGVVLVAAIAAWLLWRDAQSRRLRERFGPEYDRTMERESGDRRQAEAVLGERVSRREEFELKPLNPAARDSYAHRWQQVQADFVDRPGPAVHYAQSLLDDLMVERGYPVGDEFDQRVDLISVDHPTVVEHYRVAHRLHHDTRDSGDTAAATEKRRQALVHYRALFADLLDTGEAESDTPGDVRDEPEMERARRIR